MDRGTWRIRGCPGTASQKRNSRKPEQGGDSCRCRRCPPATAAGTEAPTVCKAQGPSGDIVPTSPAASDTCSFWLHPTGQEMDTGQPDQPRPGAGSHTWRWQVTLPARVLRASHLMAALGEGDTPPCRVGALFWGTSCRSSANTLTVQVHAGLAGACRSASAEDWDLTSGFVITATWPPVWGGVGPRAAPGWREGGSWEAALKGAHATWHTAAPVAWGAGGRQACQLPAREAHGDAGGDKAHAVTVRVTVEKYSWTKAQNPALSSAAGRLRARAREPGLWRRRVRGWDQAGVCAPALWGEAACSPQR